MNVKTTILLGLMLAGMGWLYVSTQKDKTVPSVEPTESSTPMPGTSIISQPVLADELGDIVKIACHAKDHQPWVFEMLDEQTSTGQPAWQMTAPFNAPAIAWEVQRFATQLTQLNYEISYEPGSGVSVDEAGLNPPDAVVTLTDKEGKSATFEIGRDASPTESYVRLAGNDKIYLGQGILSSLIKPNAIAYRDQKLWNFNKDDVVRVEVTDREGDSPVEYVITGKGTDWVIESPITAKGTSAIVELVRTFTMLRINQWIEHGDKNHGIFGLANPRWTVRLQTESVDSPPPASDDEESPPAEPVVKSETFVLYISDQSPLGEDTKVYVKVGDDLAVGTIMKTLADRMTPDLDAWREKKIAGTNVTGATRFELTTPQGNANLIKHQQDWSFENEGTIAEGTTIRETLLAINDLTAVSFIDNPASDQAVYGFENPQADIKLTVPGQLDQVRIQVGNHTDAQTKRLVYVRRGESGSIAKVRVQDVEKLIRAPRNYYNLDVVKLDTDALRSLTLESPRVCGTNGDVRVTFAKNGSTWKMTEPVEADVNESDLNAVLSQLRNLKAISILDESGNAAEWGLDQPPVTLTLRYVPPVTSTEDPENAAPTPEKTTTLAINQQPGRIVAKVGDSPMIYALSPEFYNRLTTELRSSRIFQYAKDEVASFKITHNGNSFEFQSTNNEWQLANEPDLPLDKNKVENLLLQIGDIATARFVSHDLVGGRQYGLDSPELLAEVTLKNGNQYALSVSVQSCTGNADRGRFAKASTTTGVFLVPPGTISRLSVNLGELEQ